MTATGILFKQIDGQISVKEAEGIVECFVAGVGNKDSVGDVVAPGAFTASLRRRTPRVVWGHDWNQPIGKVLEIYEVGPDDRRLPKKMREAGIGGLYARVQFNLKSERGREAFASVSFFGLDQEWSIGYKTLDAVYDNGKQANVLKEVELYEVSPVLHGANQLTGTISIKADPVAAKAAKKPLRDPDGGLTAAGRAHFKRTEGANLKPGVKGPADTPTKMRRKGSFLTRFFTNPSGPLKDSKGRPTRLALSARAWGEPVPSTAQDAAELAAKGRRLLERYGKTKKKSVDLKAGVAIVEPHSEDNKEKFYKKLTIALANEMDAPVKFVTAEENIAIFHALMNGQKQTFRIGYHFDEEEREFMFGPAQRVKPETVYLPYDASRPAMAFLGDEKAASPCWPGYEMVGMKPGKNGSMVPNCVPIEGKSDEADEDFGDDIDGWLPAMLDYIDGDETDGQKTDVEGLATIMDIFLSEIQVKAGRAISNSNVERLNEAIRILREILATGGREDIEMKKTQPEFFIEAEQKELFHLRQFLDPILEHYGAEAECVEGAIYIKSLIGDIDAFESAANAALDSFDMMRLNANE